MTKCQFYKVRVGDFTTMQILAPSKQAAVEEVLRTPSVQKILERICVVSNGEPRPPMTKDDVQRIFHPLPEAEAAALREVMDGIDDGDGEVAAGGKE